MSGSLSREAVDNLSAQILVNLGIIHAAGLAAALAAPAKFHFDTLPFAIGLVSAVFSQLIWYLDAAIEEGFPEGIFLTPLSKQRAEAFSNSITLVAAFSSAGCLFYACLNLFLSTWISSIGAIVMSFGPLGFVMFQAARCHTVKNR